MRSVGEVLGLHRGALGYVLGGGPSVVLDYERARHDLGGGVVFSVNAHALVMGLRGEVATYLVSEHAMAQVEPNADARAVLRRRALLAGRVRSDAPDLLLDDRAPDYGFSSGLAAWLAQAMGCADVILCGMDCYQGRNAYCHSNWERRADADRFRAKIDAERTALARQIDRWRLVKRTAWRPERIYAAGGPLVDAGLFLRTPG